MTNASTGDRYAIVDPRYALDPDTAPILSVSLPEDTVDSFWHWRDAVWPECPIIDLATWEILSPGKTDAPCPD